MFGIRSIHSILFVPTNDKPQMSMGALQKETFRQLIKAALGLEEPCKWHCHSTTFPKEL